MIYTLSNSLDFYTKYTLSILPGVVSVYGIDSNQTFSSSFTSEEQIVILNVPQYYQPRGFDCNLYSAKMALAYRGVSVSVESAKASIGIEKIQILPGSMNTEHIGDLFRPLWDHIDLYL